MDEYETDKNLNNIELEEINRNKKKKNESKNSQKNKREDSLDDLKEQLLEN